MQQPDHTALDLAQPRWVLRPSYQVPAVKAAVEFMRNGNDHNGLMVLPTGSGKSLVIANVVRELGQPCLIFQPSREILQQNVAKYRGYGHHCGVYSASAGEKRLSDVTFATIGSVIKKQHLLTRFKYLIIDECHLVNAKNEGSMYAALINNLGLRVLGLTATPYRLGRIVDDRGYTRSILKFLTRTHPRVFDRVVYYVQNGQLFEEGHLARLTYYEVKAINRRNLRANSTGADYTDASVRAEYRASGFEGRVVRVVNRLFEIGRRNCLVFTRFTEEAASIVRHVPGAAIVTAKTHPKERERVINGFRAGRIRCVCNVGILSTGFDYPELESVVIARPTRSLGLYYQMIGRCVRPHAEKEHAMVVDMGGNLAVFGKVEDMVLSPEGGWHVRSNGCQLTNVPFGERIFTGRGN